MAKLKYSLGSGPTKRENEKPKEAKYYKVKVRASDPQARQGGFTSQKTKEISEGRANRMKNKAIRRDVENTGKMDASVSEDVARKTKGGISSIQKTSGSKVVNGKSPFNLKGKVLSAVLGKKKVAQMESKKPGEQYEKGKMGKFKYVAEKDPSRRKIGPEPKFRSRD
jgi:hypothetical protein